MEEATTQNIISQWITFHFIEAPKNILKAFKNFLIFNLHYFGVWRHLKTFFAHWRNDREPYGRGFSFKEYAWVFASNTISRLLGAFVRSVVIVLGLLTEAFILLLGILVFLAWLLLPILIIIGFWFSIKLIF